MPLTLTPATRDSWDRPSSAQQSPVETVQFENAISMSRVLAEHMKGFIEAAQIHATHPRMSHEAFIQEWKRAAERCLNEFGAKYDRSEDESDRQAAHN